ncbi:MAG: hypothetical protein AB7H97_13045 [Pseudobdellovibrionaceae bacterium]
MKHLPLLLVIFAAGVANARAVVTTEYRCPAKKGNKAFTFIIEKSGKTETHIVRESNGEIYQTEAANVEYIGSRRIELTWPMQGNYTDYCTKR